MATLDADTQRYIDEGLARHTQYWYRLIPDGGQGMPVMVEAETGSEPVTYVEGETGAWVEGELVETVIDYQYDDLYWLTEANYSDGSFYHYAYDDNGNRVRCRHNRIGGAGRSPHGHVPGFQDHPTEARQFFLRYQDRILYGTDLDTRPLLRGEEGRALMRFIPWLVRSALETNGEFTTDRGMRYHGLGLPAAVLKKIYCANFERVYGLDA